MVGKSNFEFSYLLLLFTKLFYQTQILGPQKDTFPMWLPAVEGVPSPPPGISERVSCYKRQQQQQHRNIISDDYMWSCGSWAWAAPHESYQNNF